MAALPPEAITDRPSLFLDLDGTLVDLAPNPGSVRPHPHLPDLVRALQRRSAGAVAVVTGRSVRDVDRVFELPPVAVAALHGAEIRLADGSFLRRLPAADAGLRQAARMLAATAERHPGLVLEDKGAALALHYRGAPLLEEQVKIETDRALALCGPGYRVVPGKMVRELRAGAVNKGTAIRELMTQPCFARGLPVFLGDDVTDEDGFDAVNALGGWSIRVGAAVRRQTAARYLLPGVMDVHRWLWRLAGPGIGP